MKAICPKCHSSEVAGLVSSYWTSIDENGSPLRPLSETVSSNAEIGPERECIKCCHFWHAGDESASPDAPIPYTLTEEAK